MVIINITSKSENRNSLNSVKLKKKAKRQMEKD